MSSLQDALVNAGLVTKERAKEIEEEKRKREASGVDEPAVKQAHEIALRLAEEWGIDMGDQETDEESSNNNTLPTSDV